MINAALNPVADLPGNKLNPADVSREQLQDLNSMLESSTAQERIQWAATHLPQNFMVSSSFGIQAAVMLKLVTEQMPDIPVVFTDTGYLFPETYQFADELTERLGLNLKTYRANLSPAWQEARFGKLWEKGEEGLAKYNHMNKVTPMRNAQEELQIQSWFAGLRRTQSDQRNTLSVLQVVDNKFKVYPILDWTNKDVHYFLEEHNLPYHPLWEQGYVSVGDWHTTRPLEAGMSEQDTRFFGLKRECGLHEFGDGI
ncbi:phosphoadenylyl-sulfate reductase [Planctobacterium marinum]|uniref:phosphoadenylyl-sulfate reductase n=1 Tax=Planctobacterium marinum TaxID=1631968 RepID=UPI001E2F090C|nr:phosphoadenylyl-sulfate reductase [Planctobacterium marinum]MCC2607891.1 phosphoadenylyl-sulfate reductase [Planctobacterium marinum]